MINPITTAVMQTTETKNATVVPFQPSIIKDNKQEPQSSKSTEKALQDQKRQQELKKAQEQTPLEERSDRNQEISQQMLDELSMDLETLHSVGLSFAKHEDTGRTFIKVINKDTDELIREIPAEEVLDMAAKLDEMIGILFDAKV
jgi:flagellar protein FlaG